MMQSKRSLFADHAYLPDGWRRNVLLEWDANGTLTSVTPDTALRFARALGTSAQFWLNLQQSTDLYAALHSGCESEIRKIHPLCA